MTYDVRPPTPANIKQWGISYDDTCRACNKSGAILEHVLAAYDDSLQKYTWRHNKVLQDLADITQSQYADINKTSAKKNLSKSSTLTGG